MTATPVDQYQFKLTDSTAPMDPAASHPSSGLPAGLPAQGLNSQALNSSIGDQTLTSLTTTGLNNTSFMPRWISRASGPLRIIMLFDDDMKDELDELYYDFECSVVRLAIRNRIRPHLFSHYLGHSHRINGASSWNNFQKYDPEARKIYDALDCDEARIQVGALWDTKSDDEKKQYRDPTFLNTLRPMERDDVLDSLPNPQSNGPVQASRITYEKTAKMVADWVHKVKIDMASMAFYHQVEGYFVLASLHPKGPSTKKEVSFGNRYLRMIGEQNGSDASAEFRIWVAAQSIQINNGCQPTEIKRQRTKSVGDVTDQFLAREGSGGKYSCPWPGKDCKNKLKQMKLSLEIDDNHWNLIPSDMMVPPEKFVHGIDRTILACLGLNKIHITYHPDWEAPPSVIKNPDNRPHSSKRKRPRRTKRGGRNGSSSAANSNPSAANGDASATSSSTSAANGSTSAANSSTSAANSSTSAANSSTSAANSSTSAANGDASAANGDASAANGNASAANGNASAANGNASAANGNDGNASAANGNDGNASAANGSASATVMLPSPTFNSPRKRPRPIRTGRNLKSLDATHAENNNTNASAAGVGEPLLQE
ncbi:hypothetical protein PSTT_15892 [Puccinia striiformis]|uniref:Uncharacterized protein n=1 Tax=Puccinia striiformis TaxID=27350 RepID=A0A2S4UFS1_9BASI|nr:hypothetical protein PSTT_15892 [Puccinia striiformis]